MALLLLTCTVTGFSQTVVPSGSPNQVTDFKGGIKVEKTLNLPVTETEPYPGQDKLGQIRISPTDSIVRYFNGTNWVAVTTEENNYITSSNLTDSLTAIRRYAVDKDTLKVPYSGATKSVNLGYGHALIAHYIGAGYTGVSTPSEVPAWLAVKNPTIGSNPGQIARTFAVYNSDDTLSLHVFIDENNRQSVANFGGGSIPSNSAFGYSALINNSTGFSNTAKGSYSLYSNTTGIYNVAVGSGSLQQNATGSRNTGFGNGALFTNVSGENNTAAGHQALGRTTVNDNTAFGWNAGAWVSTGTRNVLYGQGTVNDAGGSPTTGSYNSMFGNIILSSAEKTKNNQVIIADGQNNRAFEKNSSGAVDIKGTSLTFNGSAIGSGTYLPLTGGALSGQIYVNTAPTDDNHVLRLKDGVYNIITDVAPSASLTGTTGQTILKSYAIPANQLSNGNIDLSAIFSKTGIANTATINIYKNISNSLSGAFLIATYSNVSNALTSFLNRSFYINNNILYGKFSSTTVNGMGQTSTTALNSTAFNTSVMNYIIITAQLSDASDSVYLANTKISFTKAN